MTASVDATTDRLAHLIDSFVFAGGQNGPAIAAMAVLGDAEVAEGLRATRILAKLSEAHQWRRWSDDSDAQTCSCGVGNCTVRAVLDQP